MWKAKKVISVVTIGVLLMGAFTGCNKKEETVAPTVRKVKVQEAKIDSLPVYVEYPGVVKPFEKAEISSLSPGKVEAMYFDVGQEVKAGDVLYKIDTNNIEAQYKQSQAGLESANVNLDRTRDSSLKQQLLLSESAYEQARLQYNDAKKRYEDLKNGLDDPQKTTQEESAVEQAQIQYNDAKKNYDDTQTLAAAGAASQQQLDSAQSRLNTATSALNGAKDNLNKALDNARTQYENAQVQFNKASSDLSLQRDKLGPQSIEVAAAQVKQAQSSVEAVRVQLNDATATSPISGIVAAKNTEVGEILSGAKSAYTIINTKQMKIETDVPDKMLQSLQVGQKISVKVNTGDNKEIEGTVSRLSPSTTDSSHSYKVEIIVDNGDKTLTSGMFARVMFVAEKRDNALLVPSEAVKIENEIGYIYTVVDNKVKKKSVTLGLSNDKMTEITANLEKGEIVVIEGQAFLNDGDTVETSL